MEYVTDIFDIPICTIAFHTAKVGGARVFLPGEEHTCQLWDSEPTWGLGTGTVNPGGHWASVQQPGQGRRPAVSVLFPEKQEQNSCDLWTPFYPPLTWGWNPEE